MTHSVETEITDGVAVVTFRNPGKRNALHPPMYDDLIEVIEDIEKVDDIRCLVFTGGGDEAFSSGRDLTYSFEGERAGEETSLGEFTDAIKEFPFPTIAMINGGTYGGAMHVISVCDLRIAVEDARFGITPAKLGLVYPAPAIYDIAQLIGPANTKEMLFTADAFSVSRVYEMGLVHRVVEPDALEDETMDVATQIASNAPLSLKYMKRILNEMKDKDQFTEIEREWAHRFREISEESDDHTEGVEAFRENRDPDFTGC